MNELRDQVRSTHDELAILRRRILERARDHRTTNEEALTLSFAFSAVCSALVSLDELKRFT